MAQVGYPFPTERGRSDAGARAGTSVTRGYLLALGLVAALTLAGGLLLADLIGRQERHAAVINVAGAQRMLSQRIAALASEVAGAAEGAAAELAAVAGRMERAHGDLTGRRRWLATPARSSPELAAHYFGGGQPHDGRVRAFLARARGLAEVARDRDLDLPGLAASLRADALGPLLDTLNAAVLLHEADARRQLAMVGRLHLGIVVATLVLLLGEATLIFRPLARRIQAQAAALEREARHDPLTGLANRTAFDAGLGELLAAGGVGLALVDLDGFKGLNDAEGHAAGDAVLRAVAERLGRAAGPEALVGRLDGDEFAVAFSGVADRDGARQAAEGVRLALLEPVLVGSRPLRVGATLGVAAAPEDGADAHELFRVAGFALLEAKRAGKGRVGSAGREDRTHLARLAAVRRWLERGPDAGPALPGLAVHLQPQLAIDGRRLVALEALVRCDHPELGRLSPAEFLPVAEALGRMAALGAGVRAASYAAMASLRAAGLPCPRVAINLSNAEIAAAGFADAVAAELAAAGVPPEAVELEITEEVLLDRVGEHARRGLADLRERGVRLALAQVGTGFASLVHLRRLAVDAIKIDRGFVADIGRDARSDEIVRAMIGLAHGLGIEVVAEGVETEEQHAFLRGQGCDVVQGFLHARPMPLSELAVWLRARQGIEARPGSEPAPARPPGAPALPPFRLAG